MDEHQQPDPGIELGGSAEADARADTIFLDLIERLDRGDMSMEIRILFNVGQMALGSALDHACVENLLTPERAAGIAVRTGSEVGAKILDIYRREAEAYRGN